MRANYLNYSCLFSIFILLASFMSAYADISAPAEFVITNEVARPSDKVLPIGVNNFGDCGAVSYGANNMINNPGNEPMSVRHLFRASKVGDGWFEIGGPGASNYDLWGSGFLSGANARVYRLVDSAGNPLPAQGNYLNLTTAHHVELVYSGRVIPKGAEGWPYGGWIANQYTTPHNIGAVSYNTHFTSSHSIENGKTYYFSVRAVDSNGNESELSDEASATPSDSASNPPRIVVNNSNNIPKSTVGQAYGDGGGGYIPESLGGIPPLTWSLTNWEGVPFTLPEGLLFDASNGKLYGTPTATISNLPLRFHVRDSLNQSDFRNYVLNPDPLTPTPGDTAKPNPPTGLIAEANQGSVTLRWTPSDSSDVVGYRVLRSEAPLSEQMSRVYLEGQVPPLHPHDYIFISDTWNEIDMQTVNCRVRSLANNGKPGWHWNLSDKNWKLALVPHPGQVPEEMSDTGESCLAVEATAGSNRMWQYTFIGTGIAGENLWYGQLEPGAKYRMEVWLRQSGLANGGQVAFSFLQGYPSLQTVFNVDGEWKKYTYDFIAPARPVNVWHFGPQFNLTGPGMLWMDNARLFRYEKEDDLSRPYTPNQTVLSELIDSQPQEGAKGALRIYGALFNQATMDSLLSGHASSKATVDWYSQVEGSSAMTLPMALEFAAATGASPAERMRPWLTLQVFFDEQEWLNLIEFLAAPYDPAIDTPASKPYAWRRVLQRGVNTPWTDEFEKIIIEIGNESWHNGAGGYGFIGFGPPYAVWQGGLEYGLFARRMIGQVQSQSPYWSGQGLSEKIRFSLNAGYEASWDNSSDGTGWYGETAIQQASMATMLSHAAYVGPKWETGDASPDTFSDDGLQETLVGYLTGNRDYCQRISRTRELLESRGIVYDIGSYEGGPSGYAIPGHDSAQAREAAEMYGKSLAMGVAAMDAWLNGYYAGLTEQMFFTYGQGSHWNSHNLMFQGFLPSAGWLAMKMRNRFLKGDLLRVNETSMPTYRRNEEELPLIGCHAFRKGNQLSAAVYSRKLDGVHSGHDFGLGASMVSLTLPSSNIESILLHKLSGNPRDNNRESMNIQIQTQNIPTSALAGGKVLSINQATGGMEGGLPAGSIYIYVFTMKDTGNASSWHLR